MEAARRWRPCDLTWATRASGSSGKVTTEISQRSTLARRRMPVRASRRPLHGAEADREAVERAGAHQGEHLAGAGDLGHQAAAGVEAARVFFQGCPHADRLGGVVLEQHLDAGGAAFGEAVAEGAGRDHVVAQVLGVEQAGVACEGAVGLDALQVEAGEFQLGGGGDGLVRRGMRDSLRGRGGLGGARASDQEVRRLAWCLGPRISGSPGRPYDPAALRVVERLMREEEATASTSTTAAVRTPPCPADRRPAR